MNPLVGLQTGYSPNTPMATWQQGMPGLMGNVLQQATPSTGGLMSAVPSLQSSPGDWSQVAYTMAGRPNQGPYPTPSALPMPPGVSANGSSGSGGSSIGGTALGLLGALAKNPSLLKAGANGVSSLWNSITGGSAIPASVAAEGGAAAGAANSASSAYAANGINGISELPSVANAVDAAGADAGGSIAGLMAGGDAAMAPVGVDAVSELPSAAAAVDAGGSAGGAAAGGLGVGAGAAAAGGLFALPLILASTVAQHDRNASQYATMLSNLNQGPSAPGYNGTAMEIAADIASGRTGEYPQEILQKAQQLGLYQTAQNLGAYKGPIGTGGTAARSRNQQ